MQYFATYISGMFIYDEIRIMNRSLLKTLDVCAQARLFRNALFQMSFFISIHVWLYVSLSLSE